MTQSTLKAMPQAPAAASTAAEVPAQWPRTRTRRLMLAGLLAAALVIFLLSLAVGSVNIPLNDIVTVLLGGEASKASWTTIVLKFRLPRGLTAALSGAALGPVDDPAGRQRRADAVRSVFDLSRNSGDSALHHRPADRRHPVCGEPAQ